MNPQTRAVVHLNVANFAVAVERGVDARLRERPVIVAPEAAARAVVYDMSEEAFQQGVRKGMPLTRARRICRDARLLAPRFDRYERATAALQRAALPYTPQVEVADHGGHLFLDLSGTSRLFGPPQDVAWRVRREVKAALGLEPIWSVAPNKLLAKVATRVVKPTGECIVAPGQEAEFLAPLPVELLPWDEQDHLRLLRELQLTRVGQVARLPLDLLQAAFGAVHAGRIHDAVRGVDPAPVLLADTPSRSLRLDHTFGEDSCAPREVEAALYCLVERAGRALRLQGTRAGRVRLRLDYADGRRATGQAALRAATANDFALFSLARAALQRAWTRRVRLRNLCLLCDRLSTAPSQLPLLPQQQQRRRQQDQVVSALDRIRGRFGHQSILVGRAMGRDACTAA